MASPQEIAAMPRALDLAARRPAADPHTRVDPVLSTPADGVPAEGRRPGAGTARAEVGARARVSRSAAGATAALTLEPCTRTGRTGPRAGAPDRRSRTGETGPSAKQQEE